MDFSQESLSSQENGEQEAKKEDLLHYEQRLKQEGKVLATDLRLRLEAAAKESHSISQSKEFLQMEQEVLQADQEFQKELDSIAAREQVREGLRAQFAQAEAGDKAALEDLEGQMYGLVQNQLSREDFERMEDLIATARESKSGKVIEEALVSTVGAKFGKELWENPTYREQLRAVSEDLRQPLGGPDSPMVGSDLDLPRLVAMESYMGGVKPSELVRSVDFLSNKGVREGVAYASSEGVLQVNNARFEDETGELVDFQFELAVGYREGSSEGEMKRLYKLRTQVDAEGNRQQEKIAKLDLIKVPPDSFGQKGLMKEAFRQTFVKQKEMGLAGETLMANIDIGNYAWAVAGYGWDKDTMASEYLVEHLSEIDQLIGREIRDEAELTREDKTKIAELAIKEYIGKCRGNMERRWQEAIAQHVYEGDAERADAEGKLKEALTQFDALVEAPLTVKPKVLAQFGKGIEGAQLSKNSSGVWVFAEDVASAESLSGSNVAGKLHAGKAAMVDAVGDHWYGFVDYKNEDGSLDDFKKYFSI